MYLGGLSTLVKQRLSSLVYAFYSLAWAYSPCQENGLYGRSSLGGTENSQLTNTDWDGPYLSVSVTADVVEMTKRLKKDY